LRAEAGPGKPEDILEPPNAARISPFLPPFGVTQFVDDSGVSTRS
jgi:hypothetical protein